MNTLDLAQPRYAHLARPAFAESDLRKHLIDHHASHGALPSVRALRGAFGGGNSRLVRIRQGVEVELGLRAAERSPRRTLGRLETVTSRLTDLGETWSPAADRPLEALTEKVEALQDRLERREAQLAQALVALHGLVERLEPALGRRFRPIEDFIAERRARDEAPAVESRPSRTLADRLEQAVAQAESALAIRAETEPPPAWVRSAAASATAALDGRLQSLEEALRDHAELVRHEMRSSSESSREVVTDGAAQLSAAAAALASLSQAHRRDLESTRPWVAALEELLRRHHQRNQLDDQRVRALSAALVALAECQSAQVDVYVAGMVALEAQVTERFPGRRPRKRRRGR